MTDPFSVSECPHVVQISPPLENADHNPPPSSRIGVVTSRGRHGFFDSAEARDVGTEGSVGSDVVAFALDVVVVVVVVVQPQLAQIVNLLLAKVAGTAGEVVCS
jgi:hypothetical protein